jgi:hypothetical protein
MVSGETLSKIKLSSMPKTTLNLHILLMYKKEYCAKLAAIFSINCLTSTPCYEE